MLDTIDVWRQRVRSLVASGLSVSEWCNQNSVEMSGMHKNLKKFKVTEPELFGGYEAAHAGDDKPFWYEAVRRYNASRSDTPGFIEVDLSDIKPKDNTVVIDLRSLTIRIGPDTDPKALAILLRAVAHL